MLTTPYFSVVLVLHCVVSIASGTQDDKRLLMHSDDDILQVVHDLSTKVQSLEASVAKMSQLETTVASLQSTVGVGGGSSYVRWGKLTCPANGTTTLYTGYMGGVGYLDKGGGANTLCLPPDPQWDYYDDNVASAGVIYGTEYDAGWKHGAGESNFFGKNVRNEDVPCSVCISPRPYQLMIPARTDCYPGWTKEYSGYLMTGHFSHPSPSEYICVDKTADVEIGGHADQNGHLIYLVEGICGSLKCPPYVNGRELTCVVCTK